MPHESTVAHEQRLVMENPLFLRARQGSTVEEGVEEKTRRKPKVCTWTNTVLLERKINNNALCY